MRKICLRCGSKFGSEADYCPHDGTLLAADEEVPDTLVGSLLLEQFRIDALIGTGGMGTVYRARQTTIGRDVAVKVLRLELARDESAVIRFEREAQLAASLDHPNLVRVFLSGRLSDGRLYIVMELLEGRSLAEELDARGQLPLERALVMILKLCAGLDAVHARGIVHQDIKPENVFLVSRGADRDFVKLVDFGISRPFDSGGVADSQRGRVFGTAAYISPEAATGDATDRRSDIYSVGVLTYQLLTGTLPFEGKTAGALLMQHVHEAPPPMSAKGYGDRVPSGIAGVIMRALAKDPADRFPSLAGFVDALTQASVEAGLLSDARALLLSTVWGDELAAPGSALSELLGSSSRPGKSVSRPAPTRDPMDDVLLASAPTPFGTSSLSMPLVAPARKRRQGWLWASLGALALVFAGALVGVWWIQRTPRVTAAEEPPRATVPPVVVEPSPRRDPPTPPMVLRVAPPPLRSAEEKASEPRATGSDVPAEPAPSAKPKRRRRSAPSAPAPTVAEDDGIDWAVPDFPDDELGEAPPPTGVPDATPANPVVIDEVPGGESP